MEMPVRQLLMISTGNGVPSRTLTSNLEFRTLPLCVLSYGDPMNYDLRFTIYERSGFACTPVRVTAANRKSYIVNCRNPWLVSSTNSHPTPAKE